MDAMFRTVRPTAGERTGRDLPQTARLLERWLAERLGGKTVAVTDLGLPQGAGMSNETLLFRARWRSDGREVEEPLVARVAPSVVTMFKDVDLRQQYDLLKSLHDGGHVRVAEPFWFEADEALLGKPFYVMRRLAGSVPVSFPVYNAAGFLHDASLTERATLWRSAVEELGRIAGTPLLACQALGPAEPVGDGFERHLVYWSDSLRWSGADASSFMQQAHAWFEGHRPNWAPPGLSWGDARIGNMMFDGFRLTGVMDWEQASLAGPMCDLGWWLFFDDFHSTMRGVKRLDGLGTRQETIALWQDLTGIEARELEWYEAYAAYKLAIIASRRYTLLGAQQPGDNLNNNAFTRGAARIMGVDEPKDEFL